MNSISLPPFPISRLRRLRHSAALRALVRETWLNTSQLVMPLFCRPGRHQRIPISSMPGVFQLSPDEALREAASAFESGVPAVLLFGIPSQKDSKASGAYARNGIVQKTVRLLKRELPDLLVITDVCLCEYMDHGHCGIVRWGKRTREPSVPASESIGHGRSGSIIRNRKRVRILNDPTLKLLAQTAVSHAEAGADIVAPSDMMDGRVRAIREQLDKSGFVETPIMSYAVKFASAFYGPFREAAESAPQFGDRRSYQMDAANANEAMREAALDVQEGADILLVKPALAYLDILYRVKSQFGLPTAAYAVSAEYSMIKAAAAKGWVDERAVIMESLLAMRRAGADILITYAAKDAARWIRDER